MFSHPPWLVPQSYLVSLPLPGLLDGGQWHLVVEFLGVGLVVQLSGPSVGDKNCETLLVGCLDK